MAKYQHEIRDPIHTFIRLDSEERKVLDSKPFQRLRHIHQLGLTHLLYPGATHRRFEHSLGVMELAGRVYDIVTEPANLLDDAARAIVPESGRFRHQYWRRVIRMAALCHDMGHLPFSHAAEDLLPRGSDHEQLSVALIEGELAPIWKQLDIKGEDVAKLAVGPRKYKRATFSDWETILAEIIVGDAFGVDRVDYLLRDSHHAGVAYGKFDHARLIDNLRLLPKTYAEGKEISLGIEQGGLHAAEALLLARYFMYTQLYFHPVRRIYDIHLREFLKCWLPGGFFPTELDEHARVTDNEVTAEMLHAVRTPSHPAHVHARLIAERDHYRLLYQRNPDDVAINPKAAEAVFKAASCRYACTEVYYDSPKETNRPIDFPVWTPDLRIVSGRSLSNILPTLPVAAADYVFIASARRADAQEWLSKERKNLIVPKPEAEKA